MKVYDGHYKGIAPFDIKVSYSEIENVKDKPISHVHEGCEIYINISGDVSFMVENHIYPIKPGDIIITKPYEYHHCIYHSNKMHRHFWILFQSAGNEDLLKIFYDRKPGMKNKLALSGEDTEKLYELCYKMAEGKDEGAEHYCNFFKLITLLEKSEIIKLEEKKYPPDVTYAIEYVGNNFMNPIDIENVAKMTNVSVNTLERHFRKVLGITPSVYIKKKRLANAVKLLSEGCNVTEASEQSGFSDYSHFIKLFRENYGMTPLKYQKSIM